MGRVGRGWGGQKGGGRGGVLYIATFLCYFSVSASGFYGFLQQTLYVKILIIAFCNDVEFKRKTNEPNCPNLNCDVIMTSLCVEPAHMKYSSRSCLEHCTVRLALSGHSFTRDPCFRRPPRLELKARVQRASDSTLRQLCDVACDTVLIEANRLARK